MFSGAEEKISEQFCRGSGPVGRETGERTIPKTNRIPIPSILQWGRSGEMKLGLECTVDIALLVGIFLRIDKKYRRDASLTRG